MCFRSPVIVRACLWAGMMTDKRVSGFIYNLDYGNCKCDYSYF